MTASNVSRIPAHAPKPQDRKPRKTPAQKAREAEADDGYVTVEQCGVKLRIPIAGKVPLAAYIAFDKGDELGGTELLLGPDQWAAFLEKNPTLDDFAEVGKQLRSAHGKLASLWSLLNEHGDAIEADLLRFYRIDLLDFHRGTLSARRLGLLIRQLPVESALVRAMNGGVTPWSNEAHRLADLWALILKVNSGPNARVQDHPVRAAMEEKARMAAKRERVAELKFDFQRRKQTYGLG